MLPEKIIQVLLGPDCHIADSVGCICRGNLRPVVVILEDRQVRLVVLEAGGAAALGD